jgi:hypothetical protein
MLDGGVAIALGASGDAPLAIGIVAAVALAAVVAVTLWARAARRTRAAAKASPTGSVGPAPGAVIDAGPHRAMWAPTEAELAGWTWSGGRFDPPDLLSGPYATHDTTIAREIRGVFRGREGFAQVRVHQRLPAVMRSAPHTRWGKVACLRARTALPRFFLLTDQNDLEAAIRPLEAAAGMTKIARPWGTRAVLWIDPTWAEALPPVLRPLLERRTRDEYLVASDGDRLFVCESSGEDERAVLDRLRYGDDILRALGA